MQDDEQVSAEGMDKLLNDWYEYMRNHNALEADKVKKKIDEKLDVVQNNKEMLMFYTLLDFRYKMMRRQLTQSRSLLSKIETFREELTDLLNYYYHFFQGMYFTRTGQYKEALEQYWYAEELLEKIPDQIEKAEFHYRLAGAYYDIGKNYISIQHVKQAQEIFLQNPLYATRNADCETLLGLNCIRLKQFEEAEHHLILALDLAQKNGDVSLIPLARYNLGYLYSEQKMSQAAIRHLMEIYGEEVNRYKVAYLLAREYFRMNEPEKAQQYVNEGLEECKRCKNVEYVHHLKIVEAFHRGYSDEDLESIVQSGIDYFQSVELWFFVQEYAEKLAKRFYDTNNHQRASYYFNISYEAKEKLFDKEALK